MLMIPCPSCGNRDETEFTPLGEAVARPDPDAADDAAWAAYLYVRSNPRGWLREVWVHSYGCRRVFELSRHSVTNAIADDLVPLGPVPAEQAAP